MERRDLLKCLAVAGGSTLALGSARTTLANIPAPKETESAKAMAELLDTVAGIDASFAQPEWRIFTPQQQAEARSMLSHAVNHIMDLWATMDEVRPHFVRYTWPNKKLLGDNPDALYYETLIDPTRAYRIRGNVAGATYTSFTVSLDKGAESDGGLAATLNDTEFNVDKDGNFEIIASPEKQDGDWLQLSPGANSIVTRHYFELEQSVGRDQAKHIPLVIEPVENPGPPAAPNDQMIAARLRRGATWLKNNIFPPNDAMNVHWVSKVPNQFPPPKKDDTNESISYAAKDNIYSMAPWVLKPDEALVIKGRFPKSRFSSIVLWNQFMQTLDYTYRQTSLNRKQTKLDDDGGFTMILAHQDPSKPNWLDTEGRMMGIMFWRFQLAEEPIEPLKTKVVKFADL